MNVGAVDLGGAINQLGGTHAVGTSLNITGGTTTIDNGMVVVLDGPGVTFTPGASYSYHAGQGAGPQSFSIVSPSHFALTNFPADTATLSFTGMASGDLYVNFTAAAIPEPATALGAGGAGRPHPRLHAAHPPAQPPGPTQ